MAPISITSTLRKQFRWTDFYDLVWAQIFLISLTLLLYYNPMEISFYKQYTRAGHVCLLGVVNHAQCIMDKPLSPLVIVTTEMLYQSRVSVWCASATHFMLGVCSVCKRYLKGALDNFSLIPNFFFKKIEIFILLDVYTHVVTAWLILLATSS